MPVPGLGVLLKVIYALEIRLLYFIFGEKLEASVGAECDGVGSL